MTTMNYPANYTAIAADEMVYLDGGAVSDVVGFFSTLGYGIGYAASSVSYGMALEDSDFSTGWGVFSAVRTFVNMLYYGMSAIANARTLITTY